jgi:hypothetical protein
MKTTTHGSKKTGSTNRTHRYVSESQPATDTLHHIEVTELTRDQKSSARSLKRCWNNPESTQYLRIYRCPDLSLRDLLKNPPGKQMTGWTRAEYQEQKRKCNLIEKENTVWYDGKGEKLMQYLPGLVNEELALEVESELQQLVLIHSRNLNVPSNEARYGGFQEWREATLPADTPCGEIRLVIYKMQGHDGRPTPAADLAGTCYKTDSAMKFRRSDAITQLSSNLSSALAVIDPCMWDKQRGNVMAAKKEYGVLEAADKCPVQCFVGIFILVNLFTSEHIDTNDVSDGWAAMAVFGKFDGAPLYVPQLQARVPHERRDVVFIRSRLLQHFSEEFQILAGGGRYVLVFTNHQAVFDYLSERYRLIFKTQAQ